MNWKPIREVRYLVIHCAATPADMDIGAKEIDRWHRQRGWWGIGYHDVIRRSGELEAGRPKSRPGAHARGYNHLSHAVCLVGGAAKDGKTSEDNFTDEQWQSLHEYVRSFRVMYPTAQVVGHRDLPGVNKGCPSFDVAEWLHVTGLAVDPEQW